jgi:lipopolysaccharide biosynthesis protein
MDDAAGCVKDWEFLPGHVERWRYRQRMEAVLRRCRYQPRSSAIRPVRPRDRWVIYFIYTQNGQLSESHMFTLGRLRDLSIGVFVVCAAPSPNDVPLDLLRFTDALYWKALPGYDFSAYKLALSEVAKQSPSARVLVMNDSVFGPFADLKFFIDRTPWDLTGFTASSQKENHIQSYAFIVREMTRLRIWQLSTVLFPFICLDQREDVINCQELRFARVASRHMSVGAFWFFPVEKTVDPTLMRPFELLDDRYPFLKKSLLGKFGKLQDRKETEARLRAHDSPHIDLTQG